MCLACEEQEYFFRVWCAGFLARGEMPPGVTEEDVQAMGFELPAALRSKNRPEQPGKAPAAPANAFVCDSPDGE
jgi:hypothetical protein